jgi:predicted dehydrogenase
LSRWIVDSGVSRGTSTRGRRSFSITSAARSIRLSASPWAIAHGYADGNYRGIGVADFALALRNERPQRCSGDLALHVLEVMEAFQVSSDSGRHVAIASRPPRPATLSPAGLD